MLRRWFEKAAQTISITYCGQRKYVVPLEFHSKNVEKPTKHEMTMFKNMKWLNLEKEDIVRTLIANGINVNLPDEEGWTALAWAAFKGKIKDFDLKS